MTLVTMDKRLNGDPKQQDADVKKLYTDNGYLFLISCLWRKMTERFRWCWDENLWRQAEPTFSRIIINGNNITAEKIARRALLQRRLSFLTVWFWEIHKGNCFHRTLQSGDGCFWKRLQFDSNQNNSTVDIAYNLEEKPNSCKLELSGGWGGNTFVGTLGVSFNNFAIKRIFKKHAWRPVPLGSLRTKFVHQVPDTAERIIPLCQPAL